MRTIPSLAAAAFLALLPGRLPALTAPLTQDASTLHGRVTGRTTTLGVSNASNGTVSSMGLLQFDVGSLPAAISADTLVAARLRLYVAASVQAGSVTVHEVTAPWSETTSLATPAYAAVPVAVFATGTLVSKSYVTVDITDTVRAWLSGVTPNHGVALVGSAGRVLFGAKEGPGLGPAATLELLTDFTEADTISGLGPLTFGQGGFVGLGNRAPAFSLDVTGTVRASTVRADALTGSTLTLSGALQAGTLTGALDGSNIVDGTVTATELNPALGFLNRAGKVLTYSDGPVGLGTSNPDPAYRLHVAGPVRIEGAISQGSGLGTKNAPDQGLITRRLISSGAPPANNGDKVAISSNLALVRDGTSGGFKILVTSALSTRQVVSWMGISSTGAAKNGHFIYTTSTGVGASSPIYADSDGIVFFQLSFGNTFNSHDQTMVALQRDPADYFWTGTVTTTVDQ